MKLAPIVHVLVWAASSSSFAAQTYFESFDGAPGAPLDFASGSLDVTVHSRDRETSQALDGMWAQHGPNCEPPPALHWNTSYGGAAYVCANHLMTAIRGNEYGLVYLTPNQLVDFDQGEAVVRVDVSTLRTSGRDWWDLYLTPFEDHHLLPLEDWLPDHDLWWVDQDIPALPFDRAVVQLGHHSYNPTKDDVACPAGHDFALAGLTCRTPYTWHWDEISIQPAAPFTRVGSDPREVTDADADPSVVFDQPAPSGDFLRFSAIGAITCSFDGEPFVPATRVVGSNEAAGFHDPGHFSSYSMPIPAGTNQVTFGFANDGWWDFEKLVRNASVWSLEHAGTGCAGFSGQTPTLTANDPVLGSTVAFQLDGGAPASLAILALSRAERA